MLVLLSYHTVYRNINFHLQSEESDFISNVYLNRRPYNGVEWTLSHKRYIRRSSRSYAPVRGHCSSNCHTQKYRVSVTQLNIIYAVIVNISQKSPSFERYLCQVKNETITIYDTHTINQGLFDMTFMRNMSMHKKLTSSSQFKLFNFVNHPRKMLNPQVTVNVRNVHMQMAILKSFGKEKTDKLCRHSLFIIESCFT